MGKEKEERGGSLETRLSKEVGIIGSCDGVNGLWNEIDKMDT